MLYFVVLQSVLCLCWQIKLITIIIILVDWSIDLLIDWFTHSFTFHVKCQPIIHWWVDISVHFLLYVAAANPLGMGLPLMGDGNCSLLFLVRCKSYFRLCDIDLGSCASATCPVGHQRHYDFDMSACLCACVHAQAEHSPTSLLSTSSISIGVMDIVILTIVFARHCS